MYVLTYARYDWHRFDRAVAVSASKGDLRAYYATLEPEYPWMDKEPLLSTRESAEIDRGHKETAHYVIYPIQSV